MYIYLHACVVYLCAIRSQRVPVKLFLLVYPVGRTRCVITPHKWRHSTTSLGRSLPTQLTPTYTTRYSALLTMVTNPPRTQTFWLWSTNSRPSLSIAATPRKVLSTLLLSPTRLSTAHRQTLCRSSQRPINSGPPFTQVKESLCARSPKNVLLYDRSPSPGFTMLIWLLRRLPSSVALLMFSRQAPNNIGLPSSTTLSI